MVNLYIYFIIIIISMMFSLKLHKKIGVTFFITIATISLIEFLLGIVGLLKFTKYLIFVITWIGIVYIIYNFNKNKNVKEYLKRNICDLLFFTIIYFLLNIILKNKQIINHNELGHWGLLVKNIFYSDSLPKVNTNLIYVGYPPIVGIWEYFFCNFFYLFKDEYLYIAHSVLQFSLILGTTALLNKNSLYSILINILLTSILFSCNFLMFDTLLVDVTISLIFIFLIMYIYNMDKVNKVDFIILTILFSFLILVKEISFLFVIIGLFYLLILQIKHFKGNLLKIFEVIFLMFLIIFLFKNLWTLHLDLNNLNQAFDSSGLSMENIFNYIRGNGKAYQYEIIPKYFNKLFKYGIFEIGNIKISMVFVMVVSNLSILIIYFIKKDKKILNLFTTLLILDCIYILGLLIIYIFSFAEWEAKILLAFERYIQTIAVVNILLMVLILIDNIKFKIISIIILFTIFNLNNNAFKNIETKINWNTKNITEISNYYIDIEEYYGLFKNDDKIYVISEFENPIEREIVLLNLKYRIVPFKVCFSDSEDIDKEGLEDKLKCGYTYVYMYNCSNENLEKYKQLNGNKELFLNGDLFEVKYNDEKVLYLERVRIKDE